MATYSERYMEQLASKMKPALVEECAALRRQLRKSDERIAELEAECNEAHVILDALGVAFGDESGSYSLPARIGTLVGMLTPKQETVFSTGSTANGDSG